MTEETAHEEGPLIQWDINKAAIAEVAEELKDVDAYKDFDGAKAAKKKLVKMRSTLTEAHKETKAKALAFGRKVDAAKNEYMDLIRAIENPITTDLDAIKNADALKEEERKGKIYEQLDRIQAFANDRHSLTIPELDERLATLRAIEIEVPLFEEFAEDAQLAKDEADMKLRLAIDREQTEQKERDEKAALEAQNAELQAKIDKQNAENAKREQEDQDRAAEIAAWEAAIRHKAIAEQEERDAVKQKELDDIEAGLAAQQAAIDEQNRKTEAELQARADEIAMADAAIEAQALRDLQAPDIDKLKKYADAIHHLIGLKPVMGSNAGNVVLLHTVGKLIEAHDVLKSDIEEMQ